MATHTEKRIPIYELRYDCEALTDEQRHLANVELEQLESQIFKMLIAPSDSLYVLYSPSKNLDKNALHYVLREVTIATESELYRYCEVDLFGREIIKYKFYP